jgi:hypothetical protein
LSGGQRQESNSLIGIGDASCLPQVMREISSLVLDGIGVNPLDSADYIQMEPLTTWSG